MGWLEIVLLSLVALWLLICLVWMFRRKKQGGCSGCCAGCEGCNGQK